MTIRQFIIYMTKINVYCPECAKRGRKKRILCADSEARGIVYVYCRQCKKEIEIELNAPMSLPE